MSTKIHNGYKLPGMSVTDLNEVCMELRQQAVRTIRDLASVQIATTATYIMDLLALQKWNVLLAKDGPYKSLKSGQGCGSALESAYSYVREAIRKETKSDLRANDTYDFRFSFTVHPVPGCMLACLFVGRDELKKIFEDHMAVEPYPFWDNTDPPEGMDYEAWRERGREWDSAIMDESRGPEFYGIPSMNGLVCEILAEPWSYIWPDEALVAMIREKRPSFERRVNGLASRDYEDWWKNENEETIHGMIRESRFTAVAQALVESKETEEGKKKMQELKDEIASQIKQDLSSDLKQEIHVPASLLPPGP